MRERENGGEGDENEWTMRLLRFWLQVLACWVHMSVAKWVRDAGGSAELFFFSVTHLNLISYSISRVPNSSSYIFFMFSFLLFLPKTSSHVPAFFYIT